MLGKVEAIIREEMDAIRSLRFQPCCRANSRSTGRWDDYGPFFRLQDRKGVSHLLGPTTRRCSPC